MFPTLLQAGIPVLASLRTSISDYNFASRQRPTGMTKQRPSSCTDMELMRDNLDTSVIGTPPAPATGWKFARHGFNLLQDALEEAQYPDLHSRAFSRQLYINALTYLLQGLPSDLTTEESLHLRSALPDIVQETPSAEPSQGKAKNPSLLHRGLASSILLLCFLLRVILPYIKYLLAAAYRYERTHRVTEQLLAMGVSTADILGKKSVGFAGSALDNEMVMGTMTYCIDGISGGLNEGLSKGMQAIEGHSSP